MFCSLRNPSSLHISTSNSNTASIKITMVSEKVPLDSGMNQVENSTSKSHLDHRLDLNDFLQLSDPYRYSVPTLESGRGCIDFRMINHPMHNFLSEILQICKEIILNYRISGDEMIFGRDVIFGEYSSLLNPDGLKEHPIIRIGAKVSFDTTSWKLAANSIYERLLGLKIGDPFVEIVDSRKFWCLSLSPILGNQTGLDVETTWRQVKPRVLQVLNNHLCTSEAQWSTVCVSCALPEIFRKRNILQLSSVWSIQLLQIGSGLDRLSVEYSLPMVFTI